MTASEIILSNGKNIATYAITETNRIRQVQRVIAEELGEVGKPLRQWLRNGAGPGNRTLIVDGSSTAVTFALTPASAAVFRVESLIWQIAGAALPTSLGQFHDGVALTTGLDVRVHNGTSTLIDLTDGVLITTNEQLELRAERVEERLFTRTYEWKFSSPLRVEGATAIESLEVVVAEDLTARGLTLFEVMARGVVETTRS